MAESGRGTDSARCMRHGRARTGAALAGVSLRRASCFRIALTCAGLALPFVAAITLPTSELNAFSLPARNFGDDRRVRREHVVDDLLDRAGVGDLRRPLRGDDRVGVAAVLAGPHRVEDVLGDLAGDRAVGDAPRAARRVAAARPARRAMSSSVAVERGREFAEHPVRGELARVPRDRAPASHASLRSRRASLAARGERRRVRARTARTRATKRAFIASGSSGIAARTRSIHASSIASGGRSGSGK